jgi:outer membrane biosynthesis protein TonB
MSIQHASHRVLFAAALGLSVALAGCDSSDIIDKVQDSVSTFNPFGVTKKKLAGQRHEVFPEGVPGVQQGIPPDLLPGAQQEQTAAVAPEPKPEPKPKPKVARHHTHKPKAEARRRPAREQPSATQAPMRRTTDPAWAAAPTAPAPAAASDPAWGAVPTTASQAPRSAAAPQAARPAQGAAGSKWVSPPSQPVPTIWPDPK